MLLRRDAHGARLVLELNTRRDAHGARLDMINAELAYLVAGRNVERSYLN